MKKATRFVGLDVHKDTIAVAVAEDGRNGEVRSLGTIPNAADAIQKLMKKLGPKDALRVCYEAGSCGYVLYWHLTKLGIACEVIAPSLVPTKPGDRVKTDRRDAEKLARCYRAGDLTPVWVPDADHEALRDLVRAREAAKADQRRVRQRTLKFLLRRGLAPQTKLRAWSEKHWKWLQTLKLEQPAAQHALTDLRTEVDHAHNRLLRLEDALDASIAGAPAAMRAVIDALQALRGVSKLTAVTIATEVGKISRFEHPRQLMGYSGAVPSEHSSGGPGKARRGAITKTGNAHLRRVLVEAAWSYRHRPRIGAELKKRQQGLDEAIKETAWKAQHRLHKRYTGLSARGKPHQKVVTAVARELLGFIWSIGMRVEQTVRERARAAA